MSKQYEPLMTTEFMVKFDLPDTLEEKMEKEKNFNSDEFIKKVNSPEFKETGEGFKGSVFLPFNFMVIKGLEKYQQYAFARECAIRHMYYILEGLSPLDEKKKGDLYEAYLPTKEGPAQLKGDPDFPRKRFLHYLMLPNLKMV